MRATLIAAPSLAVFLALLAVEGTLQLAALASPRVAVLLSPGVPRAIPDPVLGVRPNPELADHDARGFRNPVALERAEIVTLGDSQTYGALVSRDHAWPTLLGKRLGASVYNMGFGGWGPAHYFLLADQALELEPKVLIVAVYAGNDFADSYWLSMRNDASSLRTGRPHDNSYYAAITAERGGIAESFSRSRALRRGRFKTWTDPGREFLEQHFKIYGLLRGLSRLEPAVEANMTTDCVRDDVAKYAGKISALPPDHYFPFRTGGIGTVLTPLTRKLVTDRRDPRIEEGLRVSLEALKHLHARCTNQCNLLVVMIPTKELAFGEAVAASGAAAPRAYRELVAAESALWRYVEEILGREGIATLDTRGALGEAIRSDLNPFLSDWDGHLAGSGNRVIAERVAAHPLLQALRR